MAGVRQRQAAVLAAEIAAAFALAGCDPVFDVEGAFFPAWMLCMLAGIVLTAVLRQALVRTRIERYLGPPALVYSAMALLLSCAVWLVFFPT